MVLSFISLTIFSQRKEIRVNKHAGNKYRNTKEKESILEGKDKEAVKALLQEYKLAIENLDLSSPERLFATDSQIFESGGSEGTYPYYMKHHMIPEFKDFTTFKFSEYKVDVQIAGNYAFASETYNYIIVLAKDNTEARRKGVATSVLKKENGQWRIWISQNSSRRGS